MSPEKIAQVCHEANRGLQTVNPDPSNPVSQPWDFVSGEVRQSAIEGVKKAQEGATPEQLHESWCDFKREQGWVLGAHKDETAKTHPCLVPYGDLPERERVKDALFLAVVEALS